MATPSEINLDIKTDTFNAYADALQAAALTTTRLAVTSLPADLSFHRSIDPALARDVDAFSDRVLALVSKLINVASGKTIRMREEEDVLDEFVRSVIDPMEGMLESTDGALDVFLGKRKDPAIHVPSAPQKQLFRGRLDPALTHASHIPKPQLLFKYKLSNIDDSPYIPATVIPHKWCAKVPLGYIFHDEGSNQDVGDVREDDEEERRKRTLHPYYHELTHPSYPDHIFNPPVKPSLPPSLDMPSSGASTASHPLTFISTPEAFLSMANTISSVTELAVDLEHHSYRSYKGFLALMQLSTRQEDFVVDLLVPEIREGLRQAKGKSVEESEEARMAGEAGRIVARVFADPSVIKVFHGAESDIVWLQQDFNIFVVGLFDTFHASKLLEFPKHSLAYLLETYCDFTPDKRYQLADWRIRPLPAEMSTYARSDTHFLLYVYDALRLSLIERPSTDPVITDEARLLMNAERMRHGHGLIHGVLTRSARTALRLYEPEVYDAESGTGPSGWDTLARKWNKVALVGSPAQVQGAEVQGSQAAVYKAVHRWREDKAREEDESTRFVFPDPFPPLLPTNDSSRYVFPTHYLFLLAERVPTSVPDLVSLFGGPGGVNGSVPPILKRRTGELVAVIKAAMEATESTSGLQGSSEDRCEGSEVVVSTAIELSEAMSYTTASSSAMKTVNELRLWTVVPPTISISRSSLLGFGISGERAQERGTPSPSVNGEETYFAAQSMLFGSAFSKAIAASSSRTIRSNLTHAQVSGDSAERFKDLVEKIHKTLVVAPLVSVPSFTASVKTQALETLLSGVPGNAGTDKNNAAVPGASDILTGPAGQVEIPFVPAHRRQTISNPQNELEDDTIVFVGAAGTRQRKRKRDQARATASMSQSKSEAHLGDAEISISTDDHDQEVKEFDYSSVPNLLDDESTHGDTRGMHEEDGRKKKQRHGKVFALDAMGDNALLADFLLLFSFLVRG
ncbi:ribonuclease H-like domain-containing protein [Boletus edulis BED1]|uniref:Ribonuclease H-like domain-containing protein n=1 Tax=Boletus edulis BED1 TaxID=1328754 RepID=A0AAD4BV36_BOLED|nr:ribonuclease H-like domain-containing protein [Boletus edulis BED1]